MSHYLSNFLFSLYNKNITKMMPNAAKIIKNLKAKNEEPIQNNNSKEHDLKAGTNSIPENNAGNYNFKKALLCPSCHNPLQYPMLCIFNEYPCYRCKKKITTGTWVMPILEEGIIIPLWEHDSDLPPLAREMMFKFGINLTFSYSSTVGMKYWMQVCPHCRAKQGDFYIDEYLVKAMHYPELELIRQKQADFLYCPTCEKIITEKNSVSASCLACGKIVSEKVTNFCLERQDTFKGNIYCYQCQRTVINK